MKIFVVLLLINLMTAGNLLADEPAPATSSTVSQSAVSTAGAELSLEQATKQVVSASVGRVLSAKTEEQEGKKIHVIRILTEDGRIQQRAVEAATGSWVDKDVK